ncbi:hypothetical protein D1872_220310 [compost metagenome]
MLAWVMALSCGNPDHLGSLEREACCHKYTKEGKEAAMERRISRSEIFEADSFSPHNTQNNEQANNKENDNDGYLDCRKPIFRFPVTFNG